MSLLNGQGTALATRIMATLLAVYDKGGVTENQRKYPLVIRHHMRATEREMVERSATERRRAQGIDADVRAASSCRRAISPSSSPASADPTTGRVPLSTLTEYESQISIDSLRSIP